MEILEMTERKAHAPGCASLPKLAILSLAAHAWIGMWAVGTDYLTERMMGSKGNVLRLAFQIACSLVIFIYVIWGIQILWG